MEIVEVYVDPSCPWSWVTSRWLVEVAAHRDVDVRWRSFSLLLRDGGRLPPGMPPEIAAIAVAATRESLRLLRVFEALRAAGREDELGAVYSSWGRRVFAPGPPAAPAPELIADLLTECHLDPNLLAAADDPDWDQAVTTSMATVAAILGQPPATPTVVFPGQQPVAFTGPVLSPAPAGDQALRLWDALRLLGGLPGFRSLSRPAGPFPAMAPTSAGALSD